MLRLLQAAGYQNISGVDVSPECVRHARAVTPSVAHGDVLEFLQNVRNSYDLITAIDIIEHLTKDEIVSLFDSIHRALRPGGTFIIQTVNGESPWSGALRYADFTHEFAFTQRSLGQLAEVCGFGGMEVRECGPFAHGLLSLVRLAAWKSLRLTLLAWNLVETGDAGSGVYTRVILARVVRRTGNLEIER
jgi:cyclopropane fatty-acyl-phospholipid synthase-like methyltransferase